MAHYVYNEHGIGTGCFIVHQSSMEVFITVKFAFMLYKVLQMPPALRSRIHHALSIVSRLFVNSKDHDAKKLHEKDMA